MSLVRTLRSSAILVGLSVLTACDFGQLSRCFDKNCVAVGFVQQHYATPQASTDSVSVPVTNAQEAGDLNVVVVGWNDITASVGAVTDSSGNHYALAIGPTSIPHNDGGLTQSIYYAENILDAAAATNVLQVRFSPPAFRPDVRVLEYRGLVSSGALDTARGGTAETPTASSGTVVTEFPGELIFGANTVIHPTVSAGTGFTTRVITDDGDIAEDQVADLAGTYEANALLTDYSASVMQIVTFKSAASH